MTTVWRSAAAAAVLLLAGCGSTVSGTAVRDAAEPANSGSSAMLDPGNFPTQPRPPLGNADSAGVGARAEARRMGENTVLAFEVDPAVSLTVGGMGQGPFLRPKSLTNWLADPIPAAVEAHNFIAGFLVAAYSEKPAESAAERRDKDVMNAVLRFATAEDAAAAAQEMGAKSATLTLIGVDHPVPTRSIPVPRHDDTSAVTYDTAMGSHTVLAFTTRGPFVLAQYANVQENSATGAEFVAATLDQQLPLIDAFAPTPADQLESLPIDPTGVMARTLPPDNDAPPFTGDYGPHAALTFQSSQAASRQLFEETGVDAVTISRSNVYRARDAVGAGRIVAEFAEEMSRLGWTPADGVPGVGSSRCLTKLQGITERKVTLHYCLASVDRYAIELSSPQAADAHQMVTAQYLMLQAP